MASLGVRYSSTLYYAILEITCICFCVYKIESQQDNLSLIMLIFCSKNCLVQIDEGAYIRTVVADFGLAAKFRKPRYVCCTIKYLILYSIQCNLLSKFT